MTLNMTPLTDPSSPDFTWEAALSVIPPMARGKRPADGYSLMDVLYDHDAIAHAHALDQALEGLDQ